LLQAQASNNRFDQALATLKRAVEVNVYVALCRYHLASVYYLMERYDEAMAELEYLMILVPQESMVPILMAKVSQSFITKML